MLFRILVGIHPRFCFYRAGLPHTLKAKRKPGRTNTRLSRPANTKVCPFDLSSPIGLHRVVIFTPSLFHITSVYPPSLTFQNCSMLALFSVFVCELIVSEIHHLVAYSLEQQTIETLLLTRSPTRFIPMIDRKYSVKFAFKWGIEFLETKNKVVVCVCWLFR